MAQNVQAQQFAARTGLPAAQAASTEGPEERRKRVASTLYKLGITEIVFGVVLCIFCIITIADAASYHDSYYYYSNYHLLVFVSPGIWCGIFPIISGGLGVCARKNPNSCMYNANLAMSIISAIFMGILFIIALITSLLVWIRLVLAFQVLLTIFSAAAMVVCIVHSAYCCVGICCGKSNATGQVMYYGGQVPGQQYVQLMNGQYVLVQNQAVMPQGYPVTGGVPMMQPMSVPVTSAAPMMQPMPVVQYAQGPVPAKQGDVLPQNQPVGQQGYPTTSIPMTGPSAVIQQHGNITYPGQQLPPTYEQNN